MKLLQIALLGACLLPTLEASNTFGFTTPGQGATTGSPVFVGLTSGGAIPASITLWEDGVQVLYTQHTSWVNTSLAMTAGSHYLQAEAIYASGSPGWANATITVSGAGTTPTAPASTVATQVYNDMTGSNEGHPHGVPASYDFYSGPSIGEGNNISPNTAIEWWGGLYVGPNGNPATNTAVAIKNVQLYWLSKSTNKWVAALAPTSTFDGGYYSEDFTTDFDTSVPRTKQSDGSVSIFTQSGEVAHIYTPWPRIAVNNTDIAGIVALAEAKLVLINASRADDRSSASFLFNVGADPYPDTTGAGIENNPNIAIGKFKYVTTNWRSFAMTTMTLTQLQKNPPPISLTGILP